MFDILNDFPQGKCFKRRHLKFNSAHFDDIHSNRKQIFENDYTGNTNRKLEFGFIFLDFQSYTIAHHSDIALSRVSFAKSLLVLQDQAGIVRGKLFRSVTVKSDCLLDCLVSINLFNIHLTARRTQVASSLKIKPARYQFSFNTFSPEIS